MSHSANDQPSRLTLLLFGSIALFAMLSYGPDLALPFIGDDYVFLDSTARLSFAGVWSRAHTHFEWYRPWSREFHFWLLQRLADHSSIAFRSVGMLLWGLSLYLYFSFVRGFLSYRAAGVATAGSAVMALWGTPLLWISGGQDLWMLAFGLLFLLLVARRRHWVALPILLLALLSKETAATLPAIALAYSVLLQGDRLAASIRRLAPAAALTAMWALFHPTLFARLTTEPARTLELERRPPLLIVAVRNALATLNVDSVPHPAEVTAGDLAGIIAGTAVLACGAALLLRTRGASQAPSTPKRRIVWFCLIWATIGWLPLFLPSIGWHAYYGCLGALGLWALFGVWLSRTPHLAIATIVALGLLRGAQSKTLTWDWGSEWYQRRAGRFLTAIRAALQQQHPALPPHSRIYFGRVPNNIGFIAGQSPALRVWYGDPTLSADFYSSYRPRASGAPTGVDYFFRFDTVRAVVEVTPGPEDVPNAIVMNPSWEADHMNLAMLFLRAGNFAGAAEEFEKLATLPHLPQASIYAGVSWSVLGSQARADSNFGKAASRLAVPRDTIVVWAQDLLRTLPTP